MEVLERGQERYNVYCTPCHSRVGNGEGMIVQRGYPHAGDFHTARLQTAPLGHFFHVITNGYGAMPDYAAQVAPADRWAIVAYIKALQLSQKATQADVPAGEHVESLSISPSARVCRASFTNEWVLPPTAVDRNSDNRTIYSSRSRQLKRGLLHLPYKLTLLRLLCLPAKPHRSSNLGSFRTKA